MSAEEQAGRADRQRSGLFGLGARLMGALSFLLDDIVGSGTMKDIAQSHKIAFCSRKVPLILSVQASWACRWACKVCEGSRPLQHLQSRPHDFA
jgi:hypothetical protein